MNKKIWILPVFCSLVFLNACASICEEKKKAEPAKSKIELKQTLAQRYIQILREKDPAKRNEGIRKLLPELVQAAEDKKDLNAALLAGCIYESGLGVKPNLIQAAKYYRMAADGGLVPGRIALAEFWYRNEMFPEEAVQQLLKVPSHEKEPKVLFLLGAIRYSQYRQQEGFDYLKKAYLLSPQNPRLKDRIMGVIHKSALNYLNGENHDAAMTELQREVELDRKNPMTYYLMGLVEFQRKNETQAEIYLNESIRLNPGLPFAYSKLALLKAKKGKMEEAIDDAKVAYAVSGKRIEEAKNLVELLLAGNRFDEVIRLTDNMIRQSPDNIYARLIRGNTYLLKHEFAKAAADFEFLTQKAEYAEEPFLLDALAAAYSGMFQMEKARVCYEKNLKKNSNPVLMMNLAEVYLVLEQYDKALKILNNDLMKNAKDLMTSTIVAYLRACTFYAQNNQAEGAKEEAFFRSKLPAYLKNPECRTSWNTAVFLQWLKTAKLDQPVREKLKSLTELFRKEDERNPSEKTETK